MIFIVFKCFSKVCVCMCLEKENMYICKRDKVNILKILIKKGF